MQDLGLQLRAPPSWVAAGGGGGFGCVANDPETFLARETPSAFQTPMAI